MDESDLLIVRRAVTAFFAAAAALGAASLLLRHAAAGLDGGDADIDPGEQPDDEFLLQRAEMYSDKALLMSKSAVALLGYADRWFADLTAVEVDPMNCSSSSRRRSSALRTPPPRSPPFLSEGGAAWDLTKSTVKKNDVVGSLRRVIDGAHERGLAVLFAPMAYTEEDYADEQLQRRTGIGRIMFERRMFLAGSWGADFHPDLQPSDADIVLEPHKGTDVAETDLLEHLERLATTHVVICGMTANLCCDSTGRHLAEHGFDVTYLSDAIGAESLPAYEASIHLNYPLIGNAVLEVDEFLTAVDGADGEDQPQPGDTVYGSDRGKIGTIEEIVPASADNGGYLLVKRGVVLDRDLYIPIDAITRRADHNVVINTPKLVVGKMPWHEPPSPADLRAKSGPPAANVEHLYGSRSPSGVTPRSVRCGTGTGTAPSPPS